MGNPLKSEAEAFRWLLAIAAGAATVIAVTALTGPLVGALWALLLIIAAALYAWRRWQARP